MRTLFITCLALTLLAMGGKRPEIPETPSPADPYYTRFKELGKIYGARFIGESVSFSFRGFVLFALGVCFTSSSGRNRVVLANGAWDRGSDVFREMLVFHELGHCLLGRGHKNSSHSDGRRESLMSTFMGSESVYLAHRDEYLKELFTAEAQDSFRMLHRPKDLEGCGLTAAPPRR